MGGRSAASHENLEWTSRLAVLSAKTIQLPFSKRVYDCNGFLCSNLNIFLVMRGVTKFSAMAKVVNQNTLYFDAMLANEELYEITKLRQIRSAESPYAFQN